MTSSVASRVKRALFTMGYYAWRLRADRFPGVAVLCYHGVRDDRLPAGRLAFEGLHVRASELEAHCRMLRATCQPISLAEWQAARASGRPLPARPALITFDDGYGSVFTLARPILQRHGIPAVVFVCSEPVECRQLFWHDAVAQACGEFEVQRMKDLAYAEWQSLRAAHARPTAADDPHAPLTIAEVTALAATPGFEIGAHSAAHAILARAALPEQSEQIARNKARLEEWTGRQVTAFAYPNGRPAIDYTAETVDLVRRLGFESAFTTRHGFSIPDESPFERSRWFMLAGASAAELAHRLCYSWRR